MGNKFQKRFSAALLLAAGFFLASGAAAQEYKAKTFSAPPPEELAAAVRDTLLNDAIRVTGPKGPFCEIWLRKAVPVPATASQGLGIVYGQLAAGTLVGAIRFAAQAADYRNQQIKPGVYTLRYALMPVDGNHQGAAPDRDFLLLTPAALDASPATITEKELINLSRRAAGTGHPSVWSLLSADSPPSALPGMVHQQDDADLWVLYFRAPFQPGSGAPSPAVMALVVVGSSPEA